MALDHRLLATTGLAALTGFVSLPALAAADDEELREVIVTARSLEVTTPLELSRYGNDVTFVTAEQIRNNGFVDLTQAIEMLVPGAYLTTQAGPFSYVNLSLQGSRTGDVLWTVDGVRLNNRLYNGTSPADTLPASMIERVEVLKGGQGLLYGTQAVAGVINVVTRGFSDETDGAVSVGTHTRDGLNANGYLRGALGEHRFVAWASKDKSDGYRLYDNLQPNSTTRDRAYDVDSYGLKYGFHFTDALRLTLQGVHTEAAVDYPSPASTNVNERNEDVLSGRLDYDIGGHAQLFVKAYLHDWDTDYYPATDPTDVAYWGFKDTGFSTAGRFDLGRGLEYHVGYDFQRYRGRDESLLIEGLTEKVHAFYGQIRSTDDLSTRARFAAGVRHNNTSGSDATIWNVSGVVNVTESLFVEATLGTSFQLPDAYQLYAIDPFDTRGNPDLAPEKSFNVNLAIGGKLALGERTLGWQVSGWNREVKNLIVSDGSSPPGGFDGVFVNIDQKVKMRGAELLLRGALTDALSFDASYMNSRERTASGTPIADRPRHSAKAGLQFAPPGRPYGIDVALKYAGTAHTAALAGFGVQSYGDKVVANLGAHWFVDGTGRRHRLGVRVENLLDTDYATRIRSAVLAGSSPATRFLYRNLGAPRTAYVNYTWSF